MSDSVVSSTLGGLHSPVRVEGNDSAKVHIIIICCTLTENAGAFVRDDAAAGALG